MKVLLTRGHAAIRAVNEITLNNSFCTGRLSSCPTPEVDPYAHALDPEDPLAHRVRERLNEGHGLRQIALAMDLSWQQVHAVAMAMEEPWTPSAPDILVSAGGVGTAGPNAPLDSTVPPRTPSESRVHSETDLNEFNVSSGGVGTKDPFPNAPLGS